MSSITIKAGAVDAMQAINRSIREDVVRARTAVVEGVRTAAELSVAILVTATDTAKPFPAVDTGRLRQSWRAAKTVRGAIVQSGVKHAGVMEFGRRAAPVPYLPIAFWVARKLGLPSSWARLARGIKMSTKLVRSRKGTSSLAAVNKKARGRNREMELRRFAAIVAGVRGKIARHGIVARNIIGGQLSRIADMTLDEVHRALRNLWRRSS